MDMIQTKQDLKEYIATDNGWYCQKSWKRRLIDAFTAAPYYLLKKYLKYLRLFEFHYNNSRGSRLHTYLAYFFERRKNLLGSRLGIEIGPNCFGKGLSIWHGGCIVVNPNVRAGEYCTLRGANCLGNNGSNDNNPVLGDRVALGFGAVVIGGVTVADDTVIGANAVVTRSVEEPGGTYVGAPAKRLKKADGHSQCNNKSDKKPPFVAPDKSRMAGS